MALGDEGESSSNSSPNSIPRWKYHVFLSFRGETRTNFTDFLYTALVRKGICTFRDEEQLERGEFISKQLHKAIEESLSTIVVLSPEYATSPWCLNELQIIVESRKLSEGLIFPVFYNVEPSDVRYQKGSFTKAFEKHEERYKEDKVKVERWRQALRKVADLSGYPSKDRHQSQLIEEIVAELWTKLQPKLPLQDDGLVGIHSRKETILSLLGKDVCFIGIWGMGGIGKTTLARVVYEKIRNEFEITCFLANVREIYCERDGLVKLQRKLLSCLKIRSLEIEDSFDGKNKIGNHLSNTKVLLVLDDISTRSQLENLAGNQKWFGDGSKVIITTRDQHLLKLYDVLEEYPMQILNNDESLQLFCQKAFNDQHKPEQYYMELSEEVVQYAGGLPLALEVLGSFLSTRSIPEWEDALVEIKKFPPEDIMSRLRISYEALDDNKKNIFLNIACFFKGMKKCEVTHILEVCDLCPTIGINVLLERSLLTKYLDGEDNWCLGMHDLLQQMGKYIVIQESHNDVGKRSRLWLTKDINHVLTKNKGTEVIQGIVSNESHTACWNPNSFLKMQNLKLLKLKYGSLLLGLNFLPEGLKYLDWSGFPLEKLPLGVQLDEIVELRMHQSKIKTLWHGTQSFIKLKFIDLRYSKDLILFPSVYGAPCVEQLVLEGCANLIEVHESVGQLQELKILNLKDCKNLKILPRKLETDSLENFILSGCSVLKKLPEFREQMELLTELDLSDCKSLLCLPRSIDKLKSLRILNISGCTKFSSLPENLDQCENLEVLRVTKTAIEELPPSIIHLRHLQELSIGRDRVTGSNWWNSLCLPFGSLFWRHHISPGIMLPPLSNFPSLQNLNLSYCDLSDESLPPEIGSLSYLQRLDLSGNNFVKLPWIANLSNLYELKLNFCPRLKSAPQLPPTVDFFHGAGCDSLETSLDPQFFCDFFATHSRQDEEKAYYFRGDFGSTDRF